MRFFILLLVLTAVAGAGPIPPQTRQLLVMRSANWTSTSGELRCYERTAGGPWQAAGEPIPVQLGRSGLGWGRGLHGAGPETEPQKIEGDGRGPAGAFRLSQMFGTDPAPTARFPYMKVTATVFGVDDARSRYYNQLVDTTRVKKDWHSAEKMLIPDYQLGVLVDHNRPHPVAGGGSCIFLHVWEAPDLVTHGCTVMTYENMRWLCSWLRADARPVLVQLPQLPFTRLQSAWELP